jgi:hypothetical protein
MNFASALRTGVEHGWRGFVIAAGGARSTVSVMMLVISSLMMTRIPALIVKEPKSKEERFVDKVKTISEFFDKYPDVKVALVTREPTASESATAFRVLQLSLLLHRDLAWGWHCNLVR